MDPHESVLVMSLSGIPKEEPESFVFVCEESSAQVSEELGTQAIGRDSVAVPSIIHEATTAYEENSADMKSSDGYPQQQRRDSEVSDMLNEFLTWETTNIPDERQIKSTNKLQQVMPGNEDVIPDDQQKEASSVSRNLPDMVHESEEKAKQNKSFSETNKIAIKRFGSTANLEQLPSPVLSPVSEDAARSNKILNESKIQLELAPLPTFTPGRKKQFESTSLLEMELSVVSTPGNDEGSSVYPIIAGQTPGVEMANRHTDATPGGEVSSEVSDPSIADDTSEELLPKKSGDCDLLFPYRILLTLCTSSLLALAILCFIFYPKPVELCLKLSLSDEEILEKRLDDEGNYNLNLTNPNSIDVHIHGLEISAYYGGVAEENRLLNAEKMDYHIPAHSTLTSNHTYAFAQDCTDAVPLTTLHGCHNEYRAHITYDIVTSFKACILSFVCHERIVSKSYYKSFCPEDEMVCTKLELFQFD